MFFEDKAWTPDDLVANVIEDVVELDGPCQRQPLAVRCKVRMNTLCKESQIPRKMLAASQPRWRTLRHPGWKSKRKVEEWAELDSAAKTYSSLAFLACLSAEDRGLCASPHSTKS